jgi:excisionase family DNA binding protein
MDTESVTPLVPTLAASIAASGLPPVIDAEQCAALLRCSKQHLEALADRGAMPATKFGRGWVFVTAQVLTHIAAACERNLQTPRHVQCTATRSEGADQGSPPPRPDTGGGPASDRLHVVMTPRRPGRPRKPVPALNQHGGENRGARR